MINYYFRDKPADDLIQLDSYKSGAWVYIEAPDEAEILSISKQFNLDADILLDVLDENEMPRVERDGEDTYIFTRHAATNNELRITTSPILFVLTKNTLLTFSPERFSRMHKFVGEKHIDFSTKKHIELMLSLFDQIDDDYESKLNSISRQIKTIRSRLRIEEIRNKDFIDFVTIEDILNEFLSALSPTNSILRRLLLGRHVQLDDEAKDLVEDLLLNNEQSIVGCKASLKTIVNIREAYSTIMANNLNQVIRLLTVLTLIISLPTLLSSMYGMNINLPLSDSPFAFALIVICSIVFSVLLLAFFKSRKWF